MNKLVLGAFFSFSDRIDEELESLCAVGVDEMSWDDLWLGNWDKVPDNEQGEMVYRLRSYRRKVRELVQGFIMDEKAAPLSLPIQRDSALGVIMMGIEHERIHFETSSVIMTRMPIELVRPSNLFPLYDKDHGPAPANKLVEVAGGIASIGRSMEGTRFYGWDNEFGSVQGVELENFEVSQMLVSNSEYREFVAAGGYERQQFWSELGWKWVTDPGSWGAAKKSPLFWTTGGKLRTLTREIEMQDTWPVETNNYEGEAFCNWKSQQLGKSVRLISHPEWILLASRLTGNYNNNLRYGSVCPVHAHGESLGAHGEDIFDVVGNVWQHSVSPLTVLPGFLPHNLYDDFTQPTIDGLHTFILGGSWASVGNVARVESRYGFRRHFPQFSGIRYVRSSNKVEDCPSKVYDGAVGTLVAEHYLDFDESRNGDFPHEEFPFHPPIRNGPAAIGEAAAKLVPDGGSVMVFQGGPGRVSVEIACQSAPASILHTDPTANALEVFLSITSSGEVRFERQLEGNISKTETYTLTEERKAAMDKVKFDVQQLNLFGGISGTQRTEDFGYDVVVADLTQLGRMEWSNRGELPPGLCNFVKPGGKLLVASSCTLNVPGFEEEGSRTHFVQVARDTRRRLVASLTGMSVWRRSCAGAVADVTAEGDWQKLEIGMELSCHAALLFKGELKIFPDQRSHHDLKFSKSCAELCRKACKTYGVFTTRALYVSGSGKDCHSVGEDQMANIVAVSGDMDFCANIFQEVLAVNWRCKFLGNQGRVGPSQSQQHVKAFSRDPQYVHDAEELKGDVFDLIVGENLLERLADPAEWLERAKQLLTPDGLLVIFSAFEWSEKVTPVAKWLGGVRIDAEVRWSQHGLAKAAHPELVLRQKPVDVPCVVPLDDGTFQFTYVQCLVFGRAREGDDVMAFLKTEAS